MRLLACIHTIHTNSLHLCCFMRLHEHLVELLFIFIHWWSVNISHKPVQNSLGHLAPTSFQIRVPSQSECWVQIMCNWIKGSPQVNIVHFEEEDAS